MAEETEGGGRPDGPDRGEGRPENGRSEEPEGPDEVEILTLEPLIEAVRAGVEKRGWELSGLQKTTSYRFEGRWEGDSTRSAYLFFHRAGVSEDVSIDVYLDETSRGLRGNLALVVDAPDLEELGPVKRVLERLGTAGKRFLPTGYRRPLTVRFYMPELGTDPARAATEIRFKLHLPARALEEGRSAVEDVTRAAIAAFEELMEDEVVRGLTRTGGEPEGPSWNADPDDPGR